MESETGMEGHHWKCQGGIGDGLYGSRDRGRYQRSRERGREKRRLRGKEKVGETGMTV